MFRNILDFIREIYGNSEHIPLHEPVFSDFEKEYLAKCIDSTFVSSIGTFVNNFESSISAFTGSAYSIATVNGTCALHIALLVNNVKPDDLIISQPLTFIATINAIKYTGADPVFIDVDKETMGMSPESLDEFLSYNTFSGHDGFLYEKSTRRRISACIPVHTFGYPAKIDRIIDICRSKKISVIEDAAESLGSYYKGKHTGVFGDSGILSFNGNKIITAGGGGMILIQDSEKAEKARHLTTQAKVNHKWELSHDDIGFNYRMPNINAALGLAQMEMLPQYLIKKTQLAEIYRSFFHKLGLPFFSEPENSKSNYWLNSFFLENRSERDEFLDLSYRESIGCRPAWSLINSAPMYKSSISTKTPNSQDIESRVVNLPSSVNFKS